MGRRSEVSDELIVQAGLGLVTSGQLVTGWSLRKALGEKGSPPRLMAVWKTEGSQLLNDEFPGGVLPAAEVQEARDGIKAALGFIERLEEKARNAVRRSEEKAELAVENATDDAVMQVDRLERELTHTNHRISALELELRAALREAASEKAISEMTIKDKIVVEEAAAALRKEVSDLSVRLAVAEDRLRAADESAATMRQQVESLTASLTVAEERVRAAQQRMEEAEQRERDIRKAA